MAETTPLTFEQKIGARIKDSIGDLLSDEDLSKMVHASMHDIFFKPTQVKDPHNWNSYIPGPSLLHTLVKQNMEDRVKIAVDMWMRDNKDEVSKAIEQVVREGVGVAMMNALSVHFQVQMNQFQSNVITQLSQPRY